MWIPEAESCKGWGQNYHLAQGTATPVSHSLIGSLQQSYKITISTPFPVEETKALKG